MLYRILRFILKIGIHLYYKEVRVNNKRYINSGKKPLLIIANHPNTLMDAWVIGTRCKQPIYYMTKATLFDSKFKLWLLTSLNLIPINRKWEGTTKGVNNRDSLSACYRLLKQGKTIVIFPEGTSHQEFILRNLKTGTARIALETERLNQGNLNLQIVAAGINYTHPEKFRSSILIDIDEPQGIADYYKCYLEDKKKAVHQLTASFKTRLENVLITTETNEEGILLEDIYKVLNTRYSHTEEKGVRKEVKERKEIKQRLEEFKLVQPWRIEEIRNRIRAVDWKLGKMKIRSDFLDRKFGSVLFFQQLLLALLFILVALPIAVFGLIHNLLQYLFTDWIVPKISSDIEYYAPLAILVGAVLYPVSYTCFILLGVYLLGFTWIGILIYLLLMPLTGLFTYWFTHYLVSIRYKMRYMLLLASKKEMLKELRKDKNRIKELLFDL